MRAADGRPDHEVRHEEEQLARWAEGEGYRLKAVYREVDEGSVAELTALVEELNRTGIRIVVVPSIEHFGAGPLLQEHLWAYVVHTANAEVHEAVGR
jgi:hypothetical protein